MNHHSSNSLEASNYVDVSQHSSQVADEAYAEIKLMNANPRSVGLATGVKALDKYIRPALIPGGLTVIAGESGSGKTALGQQLAASFATQSWVQVITFEDEARDTIKRIVARVGKINVGDIRAGFHGREIPKNLDDALMKVRELNLSYVDRENLNVVDILKRIGSHWVAQGKRFGVVIVDQMSLIAPTERNDSVLAWCDTHRFPYPPRHSAADHAFIEWNAKILRMAARKLGIHIVVLSQLNNSHGRGEKPDMRSIRGSQGLVHEATLVIIVYVPKNITEPNPAPSPGEPKMLTRPNLLGEGWLIGAKGRRVQTFEEKITFRGEYQTFVDPEDEDYAFALPEALDEGALAGMVALNDLMQQFDDVHAARLRAADGQQQNQLEA